MSPKSHAFEGVPDAAQRMVDEGAAQTEQLVDATGRVIRSQAEGAAAAGERAGDAGSAFFASPGLQGSHGLETATEMSRALASGAQELTREWLDFVQRGYRRNSDRLGQAMQAGSVTEFVSLQTTMARENWESAIEAATRMTDVSLRIADRAAKALTTGQSQAA